MPTPTEELDSREWTTGDRPAALADRMANGIDKIERNTRPLWDA